MKVVFLIAACASVLAVFLICVFLFANGLPAMGKIGPLKFLFGTEWRPTNDKFGILPMIVASIYVTAGAILIGVPIALFTSVFMARYCPKKIYKPLKSGIELMAGVPSIVYGYFGLVLLVPLIRQLFGGTGSSMLAACILLGIMILRRSSELRNRQYEAFRKATMKAHLHLAQQKKEAFSMLCFLQQSPESWQALSLELAVLSVRPWP